LFERFLNDSINGKRIKKDGRRIKQSTICSYLGAKRALKFYVNDTGNELRLYINSNLTKRDKDQASKYYKRFYLQFTNYLYFNRNLFDNYVKLIIKTIKTFFNYLKAELLMDVGNYHESFYTTTEETDIIVLRPEQLNYLIYDEELNSSIPKHLVWVKDIFVFGCTVALRYSDIMNLKSKNIHFVNNSYYLKVVSEKTSTPTSIKLPDYAIEIVMKYQNQQENVFPKYTLSWFNTNLKELAQYLKATNAINLDGGGSSQMTVKTENIVRDIGYSVNMDFERTVGSILAYVKK
jgi:integrase